MMKLAEEHGIEACISKTPSIEYWDEMPSRTKIDSMAEYLKDVSNYHSKKQHVLVELENLTPP
jgi:D-amino-acid oxidase